MKKVIQKRIVRVVQPEIAEYYCDRCGKRCGIKGNRKTTWYAPHVTFHYCEKTCHPSQHPPWDKAHVLGCEWCYQYCLDRGETWMDEALLRKLAGEG